MIEVLSSGQPNSVQDLGRPGLLAIGMCLGGAMDRTALQAGNLLLGNAAGAAGIEVAFFPFRLRFHAAASFAVTGADCGAALDGMPLPPWWARTAEAGQTLSLGLPQAGARAYVTFGGGVHVPLALGSRGTDQKCGLGGLEGRGLVRGDRLPLFASDAPMIGGAGFGAAPPASLPRAGAELALRVLPAAEAEAFTAESRRRFPIEDWTVTAAANRMGMRLHGAPLELTQKLELLSHGIVPGTVQVPPAGQPIIQMADGNTCGGYPKIATVIEADRDRLAQAPTNARLRFVETDWPAARDALRAQADWLAELDAVARLLRQARAA